MQAATTASFTLQHNQQKALMECVADEGFARLCATIQDLCANEAPRLGSEDGVDWADFDFDGVSVVFLSDAAAVPRLFTQVEIGLVGDDAPQLWGDALEANFAMCGAGAPAFSRDPATGALTLQQRWNPRVEPVELFAALQRQCALARDWQDGRLPFGPAEKMQLDPAGPAAAVESTPLAAPSDNFDALLEDFRVAAGLPGLEVEASPHGVRMAFVTVGGVDMQVFCNPASSLAVNVVAEVLPAVACGPGVARELAETNAWLLAHPAAVVACRRPLTRDYVLRLALTLDEPPTGKALLRNVRALAASARGVRQALAPTRLQE